MVPPPSAGGRAAPVDPDLARRLLAARAGGDHAPEWLNGAIDLDQALALQLAVLERELAAGHGIGGWKVGLTSAASREKLGADERPFGFVLAERTLGSGGTLEAAALRRPSIETEMCFTVGREIDDPEIAPERILDYFDGVSAGFELNEQRPGSTRPDFCATVTDCLTNWGIVCGPTTAAGPGDELSATTITMRRNGDEVFEGVSADHCDDHTVSLSRLVQQLARHGQRLQPGQRVITGAFARFPIEPGDHWQAEYRGPGLAEPATVEITVT